MKNQGYLALAEQQPHLPRNRDGREWQGSDRVHDHGRGLLPERGLRADRERTGPSGRSTSPEPASGRPTASRATRRSSATRRERVGATTVPPSPTATRSGSPPSTSHRRARMPSFIRRRLPRPALALAGNAHDARELGDPGEQAHALSTPHRKRPTGTAAAVPRFRQSVRNLSSGSLRSRTLTSVRSVSDRNRFGIRDAAPRSVGDDADARVGSVLLLVGAVARADERPREHGAESEGLALLAEPAELVGMDPAVDRDVLRRRL